MKYLTPLIILASLFLAPLAQAQNKKAVEIKFKVTRFDPADKPPPEFTTAEGVAFKIPLHNISDSIKTSLREGIYLDLIKDGKTSSIEIPESMRQDLLLLFVPNKSSYSAIPIHIPTSKLGGGSRLLVNATGSPIGIRYGKQKPILLKNSKRTILKSNAKEAMTPIAISVKKGDKWKLVRSERWPNDRRFRSFVFIYKKPNSSRIYTHAIPDRIQKVQ